MPAWFRPASLAIVTLFVTGCYHQVVRTGAPAGDVVIEEPWTATYLLGLVPATSINTATRCPNGVAVIVTEQTFLNGFVGVITLGIYTPQSVTITCAAAPLTMGGGVHLHAPVDASIEARDATIRDAIRLARRTGERVVVHLGG